VITKDSYLWNDIKEAVDKIECGDANKVEYSYPKIALCVYRAGTIIRIDIKEVK
jgi:hypothetical protein